MLGSLLIIIIDCYFKINSWYYFKNEIIKKVLELYVVLKNNTIIIKVFKITNLMFIIFIL